MRLICTLVLVLFPIATLTATASAVPAGDAAFDAWTEELGAQAVRAKPELATRTQSFSGGERDALDRRLTPIIKKYLRSKFQRQAAGGCMHLFRVRPAHRTEP